MNKGKVSSLIKRVRETNPLIHNITNNVVANFTANGLLAIGASPVMATSCEEVAEMTRLAEALVLNTGTLSRERLEAMLLAGKVANDRNIPVVLDPVGAGATRFRTFSSQKIIEDIDVNLIRGNAAEIANLIGEAWEIKGVDAGYGHTDKFQIAIKAAKKLKTIAIVTGENDVISDGETTYVIQNGHRLLTKVTGTGCLLSAVVATFAAVSSNWLEAAVEALVYFGVAAEKAAEKTEQLGPGSFQTEFINQLYYVTEVELEKNCLFEKL